MRTIASNINTLSSSENSPMEKFHLSPFPTLPLFLSQFVDYVPVRWNERKNQPPGEISNFRSDLQGTSSVCYRRWLQRTITRC